MKLIYQLLITLSLPVAVLRLFWKSRSNPDYRKRINERFALHRPQQSIDIWIHTVSVGEFLATLPLIEQLLAAQHRLLVTTTTPTGSALLTEKLGNRVLHCYLPFDQPLLVKRFLKHHQPKVAVFVETEIWANYLLQLKKNHIPTYLINARLSEKSYRGYTKGKTFTHEIMACFTHVACQNVRSAERFTALGASAKVLGNLKFDLSPPSDLTTRTAELQSRLKRPFILAASTHDDEELQLIRQFKQADKQPLLVIAPRHPERSHHVCQWVKAHDLNVITYQQLLNKPTLPDGTDVLIIDVLGELLYFYALAELAIIGGSFVPHGGHNPLEAALFKTPCLIGEHYFNFETLIDEMQSQNAILVTHVKDCFTPRDKLSEIGDNAYRFLMKNQGAIDKYRKLITETLPPR